MKLPDWEPCCTCQVMKRCGCLPCNHRADIDILTMAADQPKVMIVECPHYVIINDPSKELEWIK